MTFSKKNKNSKVKLKKTRQNDSVPQSLLSLLLITGAFQNLEENEDRSCNDFQVVVSAAQLTQFNSAQQKYSNQSRHRAERGATLSIFLLLFVLFLFALTCKKSTSYRRILCIRTKYILHTFYTYFTCLQAWAVGKSVIFQYQNNIFVKNFKYHNV